jgi:hypothetical protein
VVFTKADIADDFDPTQGPLRVVVSSTPTLGYFFDFVGASEEFDTHHFNLPLDQTSLTFQGDFPVRIEITGPSPADLPLRVKLDNVTIDQPTGGPGFALTGDANVQMTLASDTSLTSQAGAGLQVPSGARLSIADAAQSPVTPSLTATGGSGAGIGAQGSGTAGNITIDGNVSIYAEAGGTSVDTAGIGGGVKSGTRTVTINGGTVVAKGVGGGPGIGGIANVTINGGFVSATSGGGDPATPAVGGVTNTFRVNGGNIYGGTGLAQPKNSAGDPVYPVYAAAGLAGVDVAGADWLGQTITPDQRAWDQAHGGGFPDDTLSAVFWAPVGEYDTLGYTSSDGQTTGELAANVKANTAPYTPGMWANVLATALRVSATADGTADSVTSTSFELRFDHPVPGLTAANLELTNSTGRAFLGDAISTLDGGETWTVPFTDVTRQGDVSLTITPPQGSNVDYAAVPMPLSFTVNKNLGLISGGVSQRYATPLAVVTFTGEVGGHYYYKVVDADDPSEIPASPQDLVDHATGEDTLLDGPNNLVLRGTDQDMDNPKAKTVYLTGYTSGSQELTSLYAIDMDPAGESVTLTNTNTAAGPVPMTTTSADTFKINSGLVNTPDAKLGSVDGWWAELNGLDGLRFDTDTILADGLTGVRSLGVSGANTTQAEPLDLTIRNVALAPTAANTAAIAAVNRGDLALNVEGVNTLTAPTQVAGVSVIQATGDNTNRIRITSTTGGQLTATGGQRAAGIGGNVNTGAGYITIDGDVRVIATGGAGTSSNTGGAGIGGGGGGATSSGGGAMGQITIGGQAKVYAKTSTTTPYAAAIGASRYGTTGNYLGAGGNWVHIKDQAAIVGAVWGTANSPAVGVQDAAASVGSVRVSGGVVGAQYNGTGAPGIGTGPGGSVTITGGLVAPLGTVQGTSGVLRPVNAGGDPLYPVYVPAATADGTDLTDMDIDFGVDYPLHTLTADQRAWLVASGNFFPAPGAVPLADPTASANNTTYLAGQAWLPEGLYGTVRAGEGPEYDSARALAVDARAIGVAFAGSRTNVLAVPVDLSVTADGEASVLSSTELTFNLDPAAPGLTLAAVALTPGTAQFTTTGALTSADDGATYTIGLEPEITQGDATASVRSHGFLALQDASFEVYRSDIVGVAPLDNADGRRFFTSILGGARFSSTWRGEMFYHYGGSAPASAEELAQDQDSLTATTVLGENYVPGVIDYTLAATQDQTLYVAVKGENSALSDVMTFTFPAYTGDLDWFALPGDAASAAVTQTVQDDALRYRFTGLTGDLEWLNGQEAGLAKIPVELGAGFSGSRTYTVDGAGVADATVPLRLNGLTGTGSTGGAPVGLANGAGVSLTVDGANALTGPANGAGLSVPAGTQITIASATGGELSATGGSYGAGIGGGNTASGTVVIAGNARVWATGGTRSAGIGGGCSSSSGCAARSTTIRGSAQVTAVGGQYGSGIGGGYYGGGGTTAITDSATVTATGGQYGVGIGGGYVGSGGSITIDGSATVAAAGGAAGAGIGTGPYAGVGGTIVIGGSPKVTAKGGADAAGIGGSSQGAVGSVTVTDSAAVTSTGGNAGAGIGGGSRAAGGQISINGTATVTATTVTTGTVAPSGVGGGDQGGMGQISIGDQAQVWALGGGANRGAGIGGSGANGAAASDFIKITGTPTVAASGGYVGVGGAVTSGTVPGSITVEGGFVAAKSAAAYYAVGNVAGTVTISGGSLHPAVGTKGVSGVQTPVSADGKPVYPLYIPAFAGTDLTDLDLESPPFTYEQHTITDTQRAFIASKDTAAFPLPATVPATGTDSAKLAATLWAPAGQLTGISLRGTPGFAANVTARSLPVYGPSLISNVLRDKTITVQVTANGTPYEVTSTELRFVFDPSAEGLAASQVTVTPGSAAADTATWTSPDNGTTWVLPVIGVTAQGTVNVDITSLPAAFNGYTLLGVPTSVEVNRKQVAELQAGRNWRPLESTAVVGFGSDVKVIDSANPAPTYWYIAQEAGETRPADGAAVKTAAQLAQQGDDGRGGSGTIRIGAVGTATANSVRVHGLPDSSTQVVYVATEHLDPEDPDNESAARFSTPIEIPVSAYSAPVVLTATNTDIGSQLDLTAASESTFAINGATGEFEQINSLVLPIADETLELKGLTGTRRVVANGLGSAASAPIQVRLDGSTIAGPAGAEAMALTNGANLSLDVTGTNTVTGQGDGLAVINVPFASGNAKLQVTSSSAGTLNVTKVSGAYVSGIGGNRDQGGGEITIGGNIHLNVSLNNVSTRGPAMGGGYGNTRAGMVQIGDQAQVKALLTGSSALTNIGASGTGSTGSSSGVHVTGQAMVAAGVIGGPAVLRIADQAAVSATTLGGSTQLVRIEGGFTAATAVSGSSVTVTGGSLYVPAAANVSSPKNAAGDLLYPLYVPAVLADGTSLTDLDVGGDSLPYTQHTITQAQKDWLGAAFPSPATIPAKAADFAKLGAVLWVPTPSGLGIIEDIKLGQGPDFDGAVPRAARMLASSPNWSSTVASNVVAIPVNITSLVANGEPDTVTSTSVAMALDRPAPGVVLAQFINLPGTGSATLAAAATQDSGNTYNLTLAAQPTQGDCQIGFASHNYLAAPATTTVYRNQAAEISLSGGTRFFTSIGGDNFSFTSNWAGTYYIQFGGIRPDEAGDVATAAGAAGTLAYGNSTVNAGTVTYDYAADQPVPVYAVAQATNGAWSDIAETSIPAYTGDQDWFSFPVGTFSAAVTATTRDAEAYQLGGLSGTMAWLNGKALRFDKVALELNSGFTGARSFAANGADITTGGTLAVRLNGVTLSAQDRPFALFSGARVDLTVDSANSLAASSAGGHAQLTGLNVNPGTSLTIASASGGSLTATGGNWDCGCTGNATTHGPGIGAIAGSGAVLITGNVVVKATGASPAAGIGSGRSGSITAASSGGPIVVGGQARVYATGTSASGIGGTGAGTASASGATNSITIQDDALVVAVGGASAVGIGSGNATTVGLGTVSITGGTVIAQPGAATLPAIGGLAAGAVKITGGNVYAQNTNLGAGGPVGADGKPVYPLYVPASLGSMDLLDKDIASPDLPETLHTLTPAARAQLTTWGVTNYWPAELAGVTWTTADPVKGRILHGFTADGQLVANETEAAKAFISPQFRTLAGAQSTDFNILTAGLNELTVTQDGAVDTATTKVLTFTLDDPANFTDAMVTIAPQRSFNASKTTALAAVEGSSNSQYLLRVNGDWTEGDTLRVTFLTPTDGTNTHVNPLIQDVVLHRDTTPPVLEDPTGARLSKPAGTVNITAVEEGELFYCVLEEPQTGPSLEQVKDCAGRQTMAVGVNTISVDSLTSNSAYKAYILAQDLEGLWGTQVTVVDIPPVYPLTVRVADGSVTLGSIINHANLDAEYPAGAVIEVEAEGNTGFGLEYWEDGTAGGEFEDAYSANTVYTMPSGPATVQAHFAPTVIYTGAVALDGSSAQTTTTRIKLTFAGDMPGGLLASHIILPAGLTVTSLEHTGTGEYVITITGLAGQGEIPVRVRRPGVAAVPAIQDVWVAYDSTPPELTAVAGERTGLAAGSVEFTASETGIYHYLIGDVTGPAPTVSQVLASSVAGAMVSGSNTITLGAAELTSGAGRIVYVVGVDEESHPSGGPTAIPVPAWTHLTVQFGTGGTAQADATHYPEGAEAALTATAQTGYEFAGWTVLSGGESSLLANPDAAITTLAVPAGDVQVRAAFAKKDLEVKFNLNTPSGAPEDTSTWDGDTTAKLGETIPAPPAAPALNDYNFVGWYPAVHNVDAANPDEAWVFASDVIDVSMIGPGDSVTLYGAWATAWGQVTYQLHDSTALPASPSSLGPDTVRVGTKLTEATSYTEAVTRPGYDFDGWYLNEAYTEPVTGSSTLDALAITLHARWLSLGNADYQVKHFKVASDGTPTLAATESLQGQIGTPSVEATPRDYPGYAFNEEDSTVEETIATGLTLELFYDVKPVQVTFDAAGGDPEPGPTSAYWDELVSAPAPPARDKFAFLGWASPTHRPWNFGTDTVTSANGATGADQATGALTLTAMWAAGPTASGDTAVIGIGGQASLEGSATADAAHNASIVSAQVMTDAAWLAEATVSPALDGTVGFDANSLGAGEYQFTVEFTDSNTLTATAEYTVTVATAPVVSGKTTATIGQGATTSFAMTLTTVASIASAEVSGVPTGATAAAETDGTVSFEAGTINPGTHHFFATWTDSLGQKSLPVEFTVTVQAAPTGAGRNIDVADDLTPGELDVFEDVTGTNLQPLDGGSFTQPGHGALELDAGSGVLTYTPEAGWMGVDPFTVTVCDDLEQCVELDYSFTVLSVWTPPNAPTASGDTATVGMGGTASLSGTVTPDQDHAATIIEAVVTTAEAWVANATITPALDGKVTFEAGTLSAGQYGFTVRYTDSQGLTADAVYTVTVVAPPAVSGESSAKVGVGGTASTSLTVNSDVGIDSANAIDVPTGASVEVDVDGTVSFGAGSLQPGSYKFKVVFTDELGQDSDPFEITVTVQGAPIGTGREFEVADDLTAVEVNVLADVTGTALEALAGSSITQPDHGTVSVIGPGAVKYIPEEGWKGTDPFTVTVCDDLAQCVVLHYTANVLKVDAPPAGPPTAQGAAAAVPIGGTVELAGAAHADKAHGASITKAEVTASGTWQNQAGIEPKLDGKVWFEARTLPEGEYTFTVTFTDSNGLTDQADFTVTVVASPLVSGGTSAKTGLGGTADLALTVTSDAMIDSATVTGAPAAATVTAGTDGKISFAAGTLPEGEYTFTVTYTDSLDQTSEAVVVTVIVQAPPQAAAAEVRAKVRLNGQLMFAESVTSRYGWIAARAIVSAPDEGEATLGSVHYDAAGAAPGEHPFVVEYTDDLGQTAAVTYVPLVQAPPTGSGQKLSVMDDQTVLEIDVLADVTGTDLVALTAGSLTQPDHGTVVLNGVGAVQYTPEPGWKGTTSFSVTVCDDLNQCTQLTYGIDVLTAKPGPQPTPTPDQSTGPSQTPNPPAASTNPNVPSRAGHLPWTGANLLPALATALALILIGLIILRTTRHHRRHPRIPLHTTPNQD